MVGAVPAKEEVIVIAITTRYFGATNFRGSRVKAVTRAGAKTVGWDDALGIEENHEQAARALMRKLGWDEAKYNLVSGELPSGEGNVYVLVPARQVTT